MLISSPSFTGVPLLVEEADVLVVDEDVHEAADVAGLVADAFVQAGKVPVEVAEHFADVGAGACTTSCSLVSLRSGVGMRTLLA